jgi:hypothetical protein
MGPSDERKAQLADSYSSGSIIHWKLVYGSMSRREDKKFAIIHQLTSGKIVSRERLRIS